MASKNQRKAFISHKLTFLKDQGNCFIKAVGFYISGIIATGESWTEEEDHQMGYMELSQMIDSAVVFLSDKCEELSDASLSVASNQLSQPSFEQPDLTSQSTTSTVYTSATSDGQQTGSDLLAEKTQLKPVLARISVIEEALCSVRGSVTKAAEQHNVVDQQLKELLSKLGELEENNSSRFKTFSEKISKISDVQSTLDQKHDARIQNFAKQLLEVSSAQDSLKVGMKYQAELTEKLVNIPDQMESVRENIHVFEAKIGRIIDDCNNKHQDVENITHDLVDKVMVKTAAFQIISEDQDQKTRWLEAKICKLESDVRVNVEESKTNRGLETRLQILESNSDRNVADVKNTAEKWETRLQILESESGRNVTALHKMTEKWETHLQTLKSDTGTNVKDPKKMRGLETRLQTLESESGRNVKDFQKLTEKWETRLQALESGSSRNAKDAKALKGLETRLQTLESTSGGNVKDLHKTTEKWETRLQALESDSGRNVTDFQKRTETLETNLSNVIQKIAVLSPKLQQLGLKSSRAESGFSAWTNWSGGWFEETIKPYTNLISNVGDNFSADSGTYTAPVDGLYVAAISIHLWVDGKLEAGVRCYKPALGNCSGTLVCWSSTKVKGTTACDIGVVHMKTGDTLFSYVEQDTSNIMPVVSFSCFLLA